MIAHNYPVIGDRMLSSVWGVGNPLLTSEGTRHAYGIDIHAGKTHT